MLLDGSRDYKRGLNVNQGLLRDRKVFSLIFSHHNHKCKEAERIVKGVQSCLSPLPRNQSTSERSLIMEKYTHY